MHFDSTISVEDDGRNVVVIATRKDGSRSVLNIPVHLADELADKISEQARRLEASLMARKRD